MHLYIFIIRHIFTHYTTYKIFIKVALVIFTVFTGLHLLFVDEVDQQVDIDFGHSIQHSNCLHTFILCLQ